MGQETGKGDPQSGCEMGQETGKGDPQSGCEMGQVLGLAGKSLMQILQNKNKYVQKVEGKHC